MNNQIQTQLPNPDQDPEITRINHDRLLDAMRIALHNHLHGHVAQDELFAQALNALTKYKYSTCVHVTRKVFGYE